MKNTYISKYRIATSTLIALMASSAWATKIEGDLEVKARTGESASPGNLIVDGTTTLKGITNINGSINANDTLTLAADKKLTANGDLEVGGTTTLNGPATFGKEATDAITIKGPITAKNTLTVEGALKITSVDNSSDGISSDMTSTQNDTSIPTTQAVSNYVNNTFEKTLANEDFGNCRDNTPADNCTNGRKTKTIDVQETVSFCIVGARAVGNDDDLFVVEPYAKVNASNSQQVDVVVQRINGINWSDGVSVSGELYCYKW